MPSSSLFFLFFSPSFLPLSRSFSFLSHREREQRVKERLRPEKNQRGKLAERNPETPFFFPFFSFSSFFLFMSPSLTKQERVWRREIGRKETERETDWKRERPERFKRNHEKTRRTRRSIESQRTIGGQILHVGLSIGRGGGDGMGFFWPHPAPHQKSHATVRGGWGWGGDERSGDPHGYGSTAKTGQTSENSTHPVRLN